MTESPVQRALAAATASLLVACGCLYLFLPPMVTETVSSVPRVVFVSLTLSIGLLLHFVFVGIAAQRLQRSVAGWTMLALLVPVGSVAALVLLSWFSDEAKRESASTASTA